MTTANQCPRCGAYNVGSHRNCLKCQASLRDAKKMELGRPAARAAADETLPGTRSPAAPAPPGYLHILAGEYAGRREPLSGTLSIGRAPENDIVLSDPRVSRHHAAIGRDGDGFFLVDRGSSNGTWVSGRRINGRAGLAPGAVITIGSNQIRLETG